MPFPYLKTVNKGYTQCCSKHNKYQHSSLMFLHGSGPMNRYNPSSPSYEPLLRLAATRTRDEFSKPLRHTYIAMLFGKDIRHKGCPPKLMQELLGHAIIAITYTSILHPCAAHRATRPPPCRASRPRFDTLSVSLLDPPSKHSHYATLEALLPRHPLPELL